MAVEITSRYHNLKDHYKTLSALQSQHIIPTLQILKILLSCVRLFKSEMNRRRKAFTRRPTEIIPVSLTNMAGPKVHDEAILGAISKRRDLINDAIPEELPIHRPKRLYEPRATCWMRVASGSGRHYY